MAGTTQPGQPNAQITKNARIRIEPPPSPRDIILLITIAVAFVGIVALFLTTDWSKPIYVWKHPKLTLERVAFN